MSIKAINTKYKGYNFRSRVEARWAVFFDDMGWDWRYEDEGYELQCGYYLPDFYFPKINSYAEVKGKPFTNDEIEKCRQLSMITNDTAINFAACSQVILLDGPPNPRSYKMYMCGIESSEVIFMPHGDKYYPYFYSYDFCPVYFADTMDSISAACSKRFEFNDREL